MGFKHLHHLFVEKENTNSTPVKLALTDIAPPEEKWLSLYSIPWERM